MIIFISHHLSNIHLSDPGVMLENETVVGDGTHQNLLRNNIKYAELFRIKNSS